VAGVAAASDDVLEEVVVTATLRQQSLLETPASATVLDAATLRDAGQQHFADVMALAPNLNFAGGTSRPRYFQIRGIGEREQYEGAPNPSVGFLIDDIDFSGVGMPATLFDVDHVEVLRGPQGTRYGANALAGLIVMHSADPAQDYGVDVEATAADFNTRSAGLVATGPVTALDSAWRLAVQQYSSDGFRRDDFLGRDDTNKRDELTARFKWRWQPSAGTQVDLTLLHANLDNGYDAWSIDNSWISQSDQPGKDSQRATGGALRVVSTVLDDHTLTAIGTYAESDSLNSFDADWGNPRLWAPFVYNFFSSSARDRTNGSLELRLASADAAVGGLAWIGGVYALQLREDGHDVSVGELVDPAFPDEPYVLDDALRSHYEATNLALFGQLDGRPAEHWRWSLGLRLEQRDAEYRDEGEWNGPRASDLSQKDPHMLGGHASLSFDVTPGATLYTALSRGYKAGGFNLGFVPDERRRFDPEYLWNLEVGAKWTALQGRLYADTSLFYERRRDMQIRTGEQLIAGDPSSYVFFTDNASAGYNYGAEASLRWRVSDSLEIGGALGLLQTRYLDYMQGDVRLPDREQAHAPQYQVALDATWRHQGWMARVDFTALDDFYFDVPDNNTRSHAYSLVHLKFGYEAARWSVYAWGRNVFDETYAIRGFYFANDPADSTERQYIQRGDPRQIGVSVQWSL